MARRHQRKSRTSGSGESLSVWTADLMNEFDPLTTTTGIELLAKADFAPARVITMRGIYGWLHVTPSAASTVDDTIFMAIFKIDEDEAITGNVSLDPGVVANLLDEDVLWTGGCTTSGLFGTGGHFFDIKITNMRKVPEGQKLVLTFTNNVGTNTSLISGSLRTFSKVGP